MDKRFVFRLQKAVKKAKRGSPPDRSQIPPLRRGGDTGVVDRTSEMAEALAVAGDVAFNHPALRAPQGLLSRRGIWSATF